MEQDLKKRHGCVTAWLFFSIIANIASIADLVSKLNNSPWLSGPLIVASIGIIIGIIMLLKWRKIGFYIAVTISIISVIINFIASGFSFLPLLGLLSIIVWYAILQMKNANGQKCWDLLE